MSSVQEVHAAIQALYGQNAAQQKQANEFLVRFAATPQAWEVSLQLVAVNDSAVCYFGANMLHGKCKSDWTTLPEAHRAQFVGAVSAQLQALSAKPEALLAARRLCLVMAAAAARSGPEHVSNLVQQALDLAGSGADAARVTLALEIQAAIAEEVNDADRTARGVLVNLCIPRLVEVLGTAEAVLDASSVDPALAALRAAALRAALAWLRLDERGGGGMVMSPGTLARSRAGLMRGALRALAADDSAVVDAATEFCCSTLAPGAAEGNPADEAAAIEGLVETLCAHRAAALAGEDAEHLARAVCRVAVAVSGRDASTLTAARRATSVSRAHRRRPRARRGARATRHGGGGGLFPHDQHRSRGGQAPGARRAALRAVGRRVRAPRDAPLRFHDVGRGGGGSRHLLPIPRTDPRGSPR